MNARMKEKTLVMIQISEESALELISKGTVIIETDSDKDFLIMIHGEA